MGTRFFYLSKTSGNYLNSGRINTGGGNADLDKKAAQSGCSNGEVKNVQGELQAQKNWRKNPPE